VSAVTKPIYNTAWKIVNNNPNLRVSTLGQPVPANEPVIIEHCATSQFLFSDKIAYGNDFGVEFEVSACSKLSTNKSQQLMLEKVGKTTVDQPSKHALTQNTWAICTASDPSLAEPVAEPAPKYTLQDLITDIKGRLKERGMFGIRGVSHLFHSMDKNGNRQIDINEFYWGLKEFGVSLSEEEAMGVLKIFDKDRSGTISFEEFLRALKGDLNNYRVGIIRKAYEKLDVNKDGTVRLDDIARLYDVSRHPDVIQGRKEPKELYLDFMSKWDTQVADGIITFEEFLDYFSDVSASIDADEYFAAMMKNAWKIDV